MALKINHLCDDFDVNIFLDGYVFFGTKLDSNDSTTRCVSIGSEKFVYRE